MKFLSPTLRAHTHQVYGCRTQVLRFDPVQFWFCARFRLKTIIEIIHFVELVEFSSNMKVLYLDQYEFIGTHSSWIYIETNALCMLNQIYLFQDKCVLTSYWSASNEYDVCHAWGTCSVLQNGQFRSLLWARNKPPKIKTEPDWIEAKLDT